MNNELEIILESILEKVKKESASLNINQKKILIYKSLYESLTNRQDLLEDKDETLKTIYKAFIYSKLTPPVGTSSFLGYSILERKSIRKIDDNLIEKNYSKILKSYKDLVKELKLTSSLDIANLFSILLWNGYFSENKKYVYGISNRMMEEKNLQSLIMQGHGACFENARMLNDFIKTCNKRSSMIMCYMDGENTKINRPKEVKIKYDNTAQTLRHKKKHSLKGLLEDFLLKNYSGNHIINIIEDDDKLIFYDVTNNCILSILNDETLKLINGEGKYTIFPFTASQLLGPFTDFDYLIKLLGNEKLTSNLNEEEFKEQFRKIHSMFLENKQFVNDIYTDIHKNIENINQEVREKTYKYLYCQK